MENERANESVSASIKKQSADVCQFIMQIMHQYSAELDKGEDIPLIRKSFKFGNTDYQTKIRISIDQETNVTTVTVENRNKDDRGPFGTDNKIVVKALGMPDQTKPSYDFITTNDFLDRGDLIFEAAHAILQDKNGYISVETLAELDKIQQEFTKQINEQCSLDLAQMKQTDTRNKYFSSKYKNSQEIFGKAILNIAKLVSEQRNPESVNIKVSKRKDAIKGIINEIQEKEKDVVNGRNRPVIMKIDYHNQPSYDNKSTRIHRFNDKKPFSTQIPLGDKTLASTNRSGNDPDHLLSNHVRDVTGFVDPQQPDSIEVKRVVDGHSSLSTIGEENESVRRINALQAAKEKIKTLTEEYLATHNVQPGDVVDIPFSAMILLTPGIEKLDDSIRKLESEYSQLNETRYALEYLRSREFSLKDLGIDHFNADTINVKPDVSFMNIPVNIHKLFYAGIDRIQDNVNARGYNDYVKNVTNHLLSIDNVENPLLIGALLKFQEMTDIRNKTSIEGVRIQDIENIIEIYDSQLKEQYNILDNLMNNKEKMQNIRGTELDGDIAAVFKKIDSVQKNIEGQYKLLQEIHMRDDRTTIQDLIDELNKLQRIAHPDIHSTQAATTLNDSDRATLLLLKRFLEAQMLYQTKGYQEPKNAYLFQARYIQTNEAIGRTVEAFCKSSEDRTGWMRIALLANEMYVDQYGRDPNLNSDVDRAAFKNLCVQATELAASLENTRHNSNARGLQIDSAFTDERVAEIGDQMGKTAKRAFEWAEKNLNKWAISEVHKQKEQSYEQRSGLLRSYSSRLRDSKEKRSSTKKKRNRSMPELDLPELDPVTPPTTPNSSETSSNETDSPPQETKFQHKSWLSAVPSPKVSQKFDKLTTQRQVTKLSTGALTSSNEEFIANVKHLSSKNGCIPNTNTGSDNSVFVTTKKKHVYLVENSKHGINIRNESPAEIQANDPNNIVSDMVMIASGVCHDAPLKVDIHGYEPKQQFEIYKQFVDNGLYVDKWDKRETLVTLNDEQIEEYSVLADKNEENRKNYEAALEQKTEPDEPRSSIRY